MNGLPYYKAFPRDFIEGTIGLPFEIKCAYRVVLDLIYMQGGRLPDDPRYISGLLGCSVRKWKSIRQTLLAAGKIYARDGIISNFRADKELETLAKLQDTKRENRAGVKENKDIPERPSDDTEPEPEHSSSGDAPALIMRVLSASGADRRPLTSYWCGPAAEMHVNRWRDDLGLTEDEILFVISAEAARHSEPASGPKAFDRAMRSFAAEKTSPMQPPRPKPRGGRNGRASSDQVVEFFRNRQAARERSEGERGLAGDEDTDPSRPLLAAGSGGGGRNHGPG